MNIATVIADIETPDGTITIDTRRHHCGNCEYRKPEATVYPHGDQYCGVFLEDLEPERDIDGHVLEWRRRAECLAAQVAAY